MRFYGLVGSSFLLSLTLILSACDSGNNEQQPADTGADSATLTTPEAEKMEASAQTQPAATTDQTATAGDAANGEALFKQPVIGGVPGCSTCHSLQPGVRMVGPSLADVATVAETAVEGMSAQAFLRQSIAEPDAHVTEGFSPGLMFKDYQKQLSKQQIDDLVAFLMTQK